MLIEGQITGHFSTGCSACKLFNAVLLSCRPPAGATGLILAFVDTRPCYRPTLSAKVLSPQLSASGTSKGRVHNAFYVHLPGLARPPLCLLAPSSSWKANANTADSRIGACQPPATFVNSNLRMLPLSAGISSSHHMIVMVSCGPLHRAPGSERGVKGFIMVCAYTRYQALSSANTIS